MGKPSQPPAIKDTLARILTLLEVEPEKHKPMLVEIEQLVQIAAITILIEKIPADTRQHLSQKLASHPPSTQQEIMQDYFKTSGSTNQFIAAANQALQEIIPEYIIHLAQDTTTVQRQEIENLIQNLT